MSILKNLFLFLPSLLYFFITGIRNRMYDRGLLTSYTFKKPKTIVIGNLAVGGTGKSPTVSFLLKNWFWEEKIAVLSRGYGRKTKGFYWADQNSSALDIGDEPMAYHVQFPLIPVAVGEDRVKAIQQMKKDQPELSYVILDDAFQHRKLNSTLPIVCTTFQNPFFHDHILPMGKLRESRNAIKRAKGLIVTRCPNDLCMEKRTEFIATVRQYAQKDLPVFFAGIHYGMPVGEDSSLIQNWHLFAGIANPTLFFEHAKSLGEILSQKSYSDHHNFSKDELMKLNEQAERMLSHEAFLTTHKDYVRLQIYFTTYPALAKKVHYLPMEMFFLDGDQGFWAWLGTKLGR
jgi:tetraacyldisaccharide 4'-kinase